LIGERSKVTWACLGASAANKDSPLSQHGFSFFFILKKKRECLMEQQIMSLCTYNGATNTECGFS
jgi:hypothetical protein